MKIYTGFDVLIYTFVTKETFSLVSFFFFWFLDCLFLDCGSVVYLNILMAVC